MLAADFTSASGVEGLVRKHLTRQRFAAEASAGISQIRANPDPLMGRKQKRGDGAGRQPRPTPEAPTTANDKSLPKRQLKSLPLCRQGGGFRFRSTRRPAVRIQAAKVWM
jgi:hypothetical protein